MIVKRAQLLSLLSDEDYREALAEAGYYRERSDEAAVEREKEMDPETAYFTLAWGSLSDHAKRPYRTAVAEAMDNVAEVVRSAS